MYQFQRDIIHWMFHRMIIPFIKLEREPLWAPFLKKITPIIWIKNVMTGRIMAKPAACLFCFRKWIRQTASSVLAPRDSHPRQVLWQLPPLVATVWSRSTLWPDRSIIVPIAGHGPAGCCPAVWTDWRSLAAESTTANNENWSCFVLHRSWRSCPMAIRFYEW